MKKLALSVIIPAFNEEKSIGDTVDAVKKAFVDTDVECEILVVDDGSKDATAEVAKQYDARVLRNPTNVGYGNSIKIGVLEARHEYAAIIDADGTYPADMLPRMVRDVHHRNLDMLVGERKGKYYVGSIRKRIARIFFKILCEFTTGRAIPDINSGLRVMKRSLLLRFWPILCGGFSLTTTITLASMLSGNFVDYVPIVYHSRVGKSKIRIFRDSLQALQIIVMAILLYNPIKLYLMVCIGIITMLAIVVVLTLLFPGYGLTLLLVAIMLLGGSVIMGMGFIAEQRRALNEITKA